MGCNLAPSQEVVSQFTSFENLSCIGHIFDGLFYCLVAKHQLEPSEILWGGGFLKFSFDVKLS